MVKVDINGLHVAIGDVIVYPYTSYGGRRQLRQAEVVNIGLKGNPVVSEEAFKWDRVLEKPIPNHRIKRAITTDFYIIPIP